MSSGSLNSGAFCNSTLSDSSVLHQIGLTNKQSSMSPTTGVGFSPGVGFNTTELSKRVSRGGGGGTYGRVGSTAPPVNSFVPTDNGGVAGSLPRMIVHPALGVPTPAANPLLYQQKSGMNPAKLQRGEQGLIPTFQYRHFSSRIT